MAYNNPLGVATDKKEFYHRLALVHNRYGQKSYYTMPT